MLTGEKVAADQSFLSDLEQNRELISLHKERLDVVCVCVCVRVGGWMWIPPSLTRHQELLAKHEQLFESMQADLSNVMHGIV